MNEAHWHLMVNHLPIIFPIVGVILLITGLISKSEAVNRSAYMIFILGAISAIVAMNTGEAAEEIVEMIDGINENYIKSHEESAEIFAVLSYILGGLSFVSLWASFKQKSLLNIMNLLLFICAVIVLLYGRQTGTTGGEIRHTEIREGNK